MCVFSGCIVANSIPVSMLEEKVVRRTVRPILFFLSSTSNNFGLQMCSNVKSQLHTLDFCAPLTTNPPSSHARAPLRSG